MLDEQQDDATTAVADEPVDAADAAAEPQADGGDAATVDATATDDGAIDLAALGADVETADEPAVSAEELMDIPDAPVVPGTEGLTEAHVAEATEAAGDTDYAPTAAAGDDAPAAEAGEESAADGDAGTE